MVSEAVEDAIIYMRNKRMDLDQTSAYLHTLPKGMPARVMGEIFDRANLEKAREFYDGLFREGLARLAEVEERDFIW